jgi:hypothetical protein
MLSIHLISACLIAQTGAPSVPAGPVRVVVSEVAECHECGVKVAAVRSAIRSLATSPRGMARADAAEALGRVKPACHPEVVPALVEVLLRDPDACVRREAAESIASLDACRPEAHLALERAAASDRNLFVRAEAKRGLRAVSGRCVEGCSVCAAVVSVPPRRLLPGLPLVRRGLATREINAPGLHMVITPGRSLRMEVGSPFEVPRPEPRRPPIVSDPEPALTPPADPSPPLTPPADPTPLPSLTPPADPSPFRQQAPKPAAVPAPVAKPSEPPLRRSSEKPVIPPTDLPPLVPPASGSSGGSS